MVVKVPLASSGLRSADIESVLRVLNSGKLTMGQEVKNFESKMARYLGVNHFVMVNSGSSANLLMIEALMRPTLSRPRLNPGDSVLVPAVAWPTTIWPLIQLGLNPLFVDVDLKTLAIDLDAAQRLIDTSRIPVKGLFPIHPLGKSIYPSQLSEFSNKNDLVLINDVCESLGSWSEGKHAGTTGIAGSFSFYFSHHITTMEGGGISTNSDEFADDLRSMRSHGWSRDRSDVNSWTQKKSSNDSKFLFVSTGYNVRPMEIQAAIGSNQIELIDTFIKRRREIAQKVHMSLSSGNLKIIGSEALSEDPQSHSWMLIPLLVLGEDAARRKNQIVRELEDLGIETRPVLTGNFLSQPAIQRITRHATDPKNYVVAERITNEAFMVGAHHDLTEEQIVHLCNSLQTVSKI
jgi:CDP-6-deoxy-D-xylo-4-hexulose-3-dehydrase